MDNKLILILFLLLYDKPNKDSLNILSSLDHNVNSIKVDNNHTQEKINLLKKIGPYLPEEYLPIINKSILYTEKIITLLEFMNVDKYDYVEKPTANLDSIEKIKAISEILELFN